MNRLESEKMTLELNWGEELKVFNVFIEDVDNESTYSVIEGEKFGQQ